MILEVAPKISVIGEVTNLNKKTKLYLIKFLYIFLEIKKNHANLFLYSKFRIARVIEVH